MTGLLDLPSETLIRITEFVAIGSQLDEVAWNVDIHRSETAGPSDENIYDISIGDWNDSGHFVHFDGRHRPLPITRYQKMCDHARALITRRLKEQCSARNLSGTFLEGVDHSFDSSSNSPALFFPKEQMEVNFMILHWSSTVEGLKRLGLVCRRLHNIVELILYREGGPTDNLEQYVLFMLRRPDLARQVRSLTINCDPGEPNPDREMLPYETAFDISRFQTKLASLSRESETFTITDLERRLDANMNSKMNSTGEKLKRHPWFLRILLCYLLPNLRHLKFELDETVRDDYASQVDFFNALHHEPNIMETACGMLSFQNVQEVSFVWNPANLRRDPFNPQKLVPFFLLPKVHTIYLSGLLAAPPPRIADASKWFGQSHVKRLMLDFAIVPLKTLVFLLRLPRALEQFSLTLPHGLIDKLDQVSKVRHVIRALTHQRHSLKILNIRGNHQRAGGTEKAIGWLKSFEQLQELTVPSASLFNLASEASTDASQNYDPRLVDRDPRLVGSLPRSITRLNLLIPDLWAVSCWGPVLKALFESKASSVPFLAYIKIEQWGKGNPLEPTPDEQEQIAKQIAKMKQEGREVGVTLEVRLDAMEEAGYAGTWEYDVESDSDYE